MFAQPRPLLPNMAEVTAEEVVEVEVSTAEEAAVFTVVVPTAAASTVVGLMAVATMVEDIPTAAIAAGVLCMAEAAGTEG